MNSEYISVLIAHFQLIYSTKDNDAIINIDKSNIITFY